MNRRRFLQTSVGIATVASAGCLSSLGFETTTARAAPPLLEDRPDAVYVPTHVEGMAMAGMADAGPYRCALTYSYPHRFWLVTGRETQLVEIDGEDSLHLMVSCWDAETGVVPPNGSVSMTIDRNGETVVEKPPWPMLSQNMGVHFGDNVALPGEGAFDVSVELGPLQTRRTGAFADRFEASASAEFTLEFDRADLEELSYMRLDDRAGERGAVDPMQMEMMQIAQLPTAADLPGRAIGEATSGDGRFLVRALEMPPEGVDGEGPYLAVSARTPYNRYPLPFMSLSATVERGGKTGFDGALTPTLDPDLDYHYGAAVGRLESGDVITLDPGAPPQVARHEGYETAFLELSEMTLTA